MAKKANSKKTEPIVEASIIEQITETSEVETNTKDVKESNVEETELNNVKNIQEEIQKTIESETEKVKNIIDNIRTEETEFLNKLDMSQQEETKKLVEQELKKVNSAIKELDGKIDELTKNVNNKRFVTSTNWNGWGYGN